MRTTRPRLLLAPITSGLLLLSACCGTSEGNIPSPSKGVGPAPDASPDAGATPAPVVGPTGADADQVRANASKGVGHCASDELVLFDCGVKGDKRVSLCGSATLETVQYRFGPKGAPELVYPEDGDRTKLKYGHEAWARGEEHSVSFTRGEHTYRVVDAMGSGIDGEANNYQGVKVFEGGEEIAFLQCTTIYDSQLDRVETILK